MEYYFSHKAHFGVNSQEGMLGSVQIIWVGEGRQSIWSANSGMDVTNKIKMINHNLFYKNGMKRKKEIPHLMDYCYFETLSYIQLCFSYNC